MAKRAFVHLEGVSDEWIEKTEAKKVAGGQTLPSIAEARRALANWARIAAFGR